MDRFSIFLTDYLLRYGVIEVEDYEIYKYGFLTGTEMLVCIITCYLAAIRMGMFGKCTLLLAILLSLRSYVGGIHLHSFKSCYICSCVVILLTLLVVENISLPQIYSLIISILEMIVIFFLEPVENMNRPVKDNEKKIFINRIRIILLIIFIAAIFCYFFGLNSYLDTIAYTLGIIFISMLLGKVKIEQSEV